MYEVMILVSKLWLRFGSYSNLSTARFCAEMHKSDVKVDGIAIRNIVTNEVTKVWAKDKYAERAIYLYRNYYKTEF